MIRQSALELGLEPDEEFVRQVVALRWGPAANAATVAWVEVADQQPYFQLVRQAAEVGREDQRRLQGCSSLALVRQQRVGQPPNMPPSLAATCSHPLPPQPSLRPALRSELLAIRHCVFLMGPSGCGRSEVIRVLAKAITTGCAQPTNPYLQANNRKKVMPGASRKLGGHLICGWDQGLESGKGLAAILAGARSCALTLQVVVRDINPKSITTQVRLKRNRARSPAPPAAVWMRMLLY